MARLPVTPALLGALGGSGCASTGEVTTAPALPPVLTEPDRVRFVAVGDTGKGNAGQRAVAAAMARVCASEGCDFVLLLGDNLYDGGMESADDPRADTIVGDPYTPIAPVYAVLGNHDWNNRDAQRADWALAWAARRDRFEQPAHAWSFTAGPVFLAGVDTNAVFQFGEGFQAGWLAAQLDASTAPYRIVAGHHPLRSNGPHGNAGAYEGHSWIPWASGRSVARFYDAAVCGRVDLALSGHDHSRQLLSHCGVDLVVSGAGATVTETVDRGNAPRFAAATLGFAWLDLGPEGGVVRFYTADGAMEGEFPLTPHPR